MIITKFETWWVERGRCLFDEKRQGGAKMGWDVLVLKLTTDTGIEGISYRKTQERQKQPPVTNPYPPKLYGFTSRNTVSESAQITKQEKVLEFQRLSSF